MVRDVQTVLSTPEVTVVWAPALDSSRAHAHALLIQAVCDAHGLDPAQVTVTHHCPRCGATDHGIPALTHRRARLSLAVSLSRAPGIVVAAWGRVAGLGVDVEQVGAAADAALDAVLRHPAEPAPADARERTRAWVRKEAALKAWGTGLYVEPSRVRLTETSATTDTATAPVSLVDVDIPGYQGCLAQLLP